MSLSSAFDPRQAEGFRCPLFPTETAGDVKFDDLRPGLTIEEQVDEVTGLSQDVVTLPPGDEKHQPAILVRDSSGKVRKKYLMPSRAHKNMSTAH